MKDGSTHQAIRWIRPDSGDSHVVSDRNKEYTTEGLGASKEEAMQNIADSDLKPLQKVRKLVAAGVYDQATLAKLSGHKYPSDIAALVKKEVDINVHEFKHPNEALPTVASPGHIPLDDEEGQRMCISDIQAQLGAKQALEAQKGYKDELIQKYGITANTKWNSYERKLNMLLDGELALRAVMAYGTGGIGKTYTFEKIAQERKMIAFDEEYDMEPGGEEYDYVKLGGHIGRKEVQRAMYTHRNKILVFDDLDSIWDDESLINVLKNTLDTSGDGKCQWAQRLPETEKGKGDVVPSTFRFNGRMIFITNLSKADMVAKKATPITESRAAGMDLSMNMEQTLDRLQDILPHITLKDEARNKMVDVTPEDKNMALEVLRTLAPVATIDQLNTRVLTGIIAQARYQRRTKGDYDKKELIGELAIQYGI
jgi:hypothetical protein